MLDKYMNAKITVFCTTYIYTGTLIKFTDNFLELVDASIVFETGAFDEPEWKDAQKLPNVWVIAMSSVESFGFLK